MCKNDKNTKDSNKNSISPHIIWVISILVVIIILLTAGILCNNVCCAESIKVYIEYSATLLSITLSIFAIAFTYTSNNTIQRQFDKIDFASRNIEKSADSLQESEKEISRTIGQVHERMKNIEEVMGYIKDNIPNSLPEQTSDIGSTGQNQINS